MTKQKPTAYRIPLSGALCMFLVIAAMIAAAELTGEKEIIFPEVAALSAGCFLAPALTWKTSYMKMLICIALCALFGVLIVRFVPLPLTAQFVLAFAVGQLVLFFSRTTFAPMISAIALPVLIQTKSAVYIAAAIFLTMLVVALRLLLEALGKKTRAAYEPVHHEAKSFWIAAAFRTALVALFAGTCLHFSVPFCIAPPLLVAFTELTSKNNASSKRLIAVVALVALCALSGALCRYLLTMQLSLPLTVSAICTCVPVLLLVRTFAFPFPPAAAMSQLALLIPDEAVAAYPLEVCAGICLFAIFALCFERISWRKACQKKEKSNLM